MFFAFLALPHGSYFCPVRNLPIEAGNGQSSRCLLFGSPAGSATAPPTHSPAHGAGGQSGYAFFLAGLLHTRSRLAKRPPHLDAVVSYWGLSSKAPKPPLDRFRSNVSRTTHLQTFAYITAIAFGHISNRKGILYE